MIVFPNCKINLGLRVLDKRPDGFHNIETIFYPVQWCDVIEILPSEKFSFMAEGLKIDGSEKENLCVKAFELLQREFKIPAVKMCLLKNIPIGSGLGGGSGDAAFTLKLLSEYFDIKISDEQLRQFASQLGSDCAFFIDNKPCLATGRGNELHHLYFTLSSYHIVIVVPPIHINTTWAYEQLAVGNMQLTDQENTLEKIIQQPIETWRDHLQNDFEEIVFKHHPEIASIKNQLYDSGALYASMSGSGSAVYGIFKEPSDISFAFPYKTFHGKL